MAHSQEVTFSRHPEVARMQQMALNHRLTEYHGLTEELSSSLSGEDLGEVLLYRAQIKLLTADETLVRDLEQAKSLLPEGSKVTPFLDLITPQDPNGFIVFSPERGYIVRFLKALEKAEGLFLQMCGELSADMCRQIASEALYFTGRISEGIRIGDALYRKYADRGIYRRAMLSGYTLIRCHLATGEETRVEEIIRQIIRWSKEDPVSGNIYQIIRAWMNLTTGWCGESPRYHVTPEGIVFPALEDRIEAIQKGIAELGPAEAPFAMLAKLHCGDVIAMREYYMDIFYTMAQFHMGDKKGSAERFYQVYTIAEGNHLVMPLVEYGKQLLPLLDYVREGDREGRYSAEWMDELARLSQEYETNLEKYRSE